ncbi:DnaJ-domain-containing protein, partial [Mycena latifolia]
DSSLDCYAILDVTPRSSLAEIKSAYHRALLRSHPDKNVASATSPVDIASIQEAYRILSTPSLRAQHDIRLRIPTGPRPAQVISLEDFQENPELDSWSHSCRCGGAYKITGEEMESGQHLIPCTSCSEIVWVGYELAEE